VKLGSDNLSLHLFGWGRADLSDASGPDGSKSGGYLNYGYMQYQFNQANAEVKAGRFTVNQGGGFEQVDGVSARTDLRGGFSVSGFVGKPVLYRTVDATTQKDYEFQRDFIFGTRLAWRMPKVGEIGLSFLEDGTKAAKDLDIPSTTDYTRKQVGADILIAPVAMFSVRGRTIFDVASHPEVAVGKAKPSNIAEHDYTGTVKLGEQVSVSGNYAERNFYAYFAGTNLPSLFKQEDKRGMDAFRGWGGNITWNTPWAVQAVADYRHTHRDLYGDTNRVGGELRWANGEKSILAGAGAHYVNAANVLLVDATMPYKSLKHAEARAWGMVVKGKFTASLDGIYQRYSKADPGLAVAPTLKAPDSLYEVVGSLGYQASTNVKVSGDLSYGTTAAAQHETRGLLRAEYRFGFGKKGGN
jgi:hypothetical protein